MRCADSGKMDASLVKLLGSEGSACAVVRVQSPRQLGMLSRHFDVAARFPFINSVGVRLSRSDAERLVAMQEVVSVTAQGRVRALADAASGVPSASEGNDGYAADTLGVRGLTGRGVRLAVLDTGVSPHLDLSVPKDRIAVFRDFTGEGEFPYDDNGHGTFVAGVAAGGGTLSAGEVRGVAPEAEIVAVKVIGASGETGAFTILEGMQWLFDNCEKLGVKVACMSFGADPLPSSDPLKMGADMLSRRGITVVCASGNSGAGTLKSPGVSREVISVGAVDERLKVAEFTSSGVYQGPRSRRARGGRRRDVRRHVGHFRRRSVRCGRVLPSARALCSPHAERGKTHDRRLLSRLGRHKSVQALIRRRFWRKRKQHRRVLSFIW